MMDVYIDGVVYERRSQGGISRIFNEVLPRMCGIQDDLVIHLLMFYAPILPRPKHSRIVEHRLFPNEILSTINRKTGGFLTKTKKIFTRLNLRDVSRKIWHSTYYSYLPMWNGPYVVTVYDLIHEKYPEIFTIRRKLFFENAKKSVKQTSSFVSPIRQEKS